MALDQDTAPDTLDYIFQCLNASVHNLPWPPQPLDLCISELNQLIAAHHLRLLCHPHIPQSFATIHDLTSRYLRFMQALLGVTAILHMHHIPHIILKGIPLNIQLYDQHCVRELRDIDILVATQDIHATHEHLLHLGYQLKSIVHPRYFANDYAFLTQYLDQLSYWHPAKQVYIELNWQPNNRYTHFLTQQFAVHTQNIMIFDTEHNFLYLCTHAAKHLWDHLKWLLDLAVFIKKFSICWPKVIALAQQTQSTRILLEARLLLQRHFQIDIGDIPHSRWDALVVQIRLQFIKKQWIKKSPFALRLFFIWLACPSIAKKYQFFVRTLLVRVASLQHIGSLAQPSPGKMIWKSFVTRRI